MTIFSLANLLITAATGGVVLYLTKRDITKTVELDLSEVPKFEKIQEFKETHPVKGGFMSKELWEKLKGREEEEKELSEEEQKIIKDWKRASKEGRKRDKKLNQDLATMEKWIVGNLKSGNNLVTDPRWYPPAYEHELFELGQQLYINNLFPNLNLNEEENYGASEIEKAYPYITSIYHLYRINDLIFNFKYGPSAFSWKFVPFKLKGQKVKLYLVSIDIGLLAEKESFLIHKVGITKREVADGTSKSRFPSKIAKFTRVLRVIEYEDGRDAFIREQKIIRDSALEESLFEKKYDIENGDYSFHKHPRRLRRNQIGEPLPRKIQNILGVMEWIYIYFSEDYIKDKFDRLNAYSPDF